MMLVSFPSGSNFFQLLCGIIAALHFPDVTPVNPSCQLLVSTIIGCRAGFVNKLRSVRAPKLGGAGAQTVRPAKLFIFATSLFPLLVTTTHTCCCGSLTKGTWSM